MQKYAENGSVLAAQSLRQQATDNTGQHISHAAAGHPRVAGTVDTYSPVGESDDGARPFENEHQMILRGKLAGHSHPVFFHLSHTGSNQTGHFAGMGGQNQMTAAVPLQHLNMLGQSVQTVSVNHQGQRTFPQQVAHQRKGFGMLAEPRADGQRIAVLPQLH